MSYPNEIFDLNNEYTPSQFIPIQAGIYEINAGVGFTTNNPNLNQQILLTMLVNGITKTSATNFFIGGTGFSNINRITVSTILQLNVGDVVTVIFNCFSNLGGTGFIDIGSYTYFAAARFPSP
ncbi:MULTISPECIES: ABC transporter permease [Bacillus cereus group]|uniref:ABC transporter permease n=1 Tax=Bacillus cereus TaxID=1396 RepID=UPI0002E3E5BD|nr:MULTISPECIES: ABC transporter permease [Bacillus cereus group]